MGLDLVGVESGEAGLSWDDWVPPYRLLSSRRLDGLSSEQVVSEFKIQRTEATRPFEALLRSCNNNSIEFSVG